MVSYEPPRVIISPFNPSVFTSNTDTLTVGEADLLFLRQAGDTASGRINFNAGLSTANIYNGAFTFSVPSSSGQLALVSQIPTNSSFVDLTTNQTVGGNKTFTGPVVGDSLSSTKQFCATMQTGAIGSTSSGGTIFVIFQGVGAATFNPTGYFTCLDGSGSIAFTVSGTLPQFFMVTANISWASNSTGYRRIFVDGGGVTYLDSVVSAVSGEDTRMTASRIFAINSLGTFTLVCRVLQTSGGNLNYGVGASNPTTFGVHKLN